MKVSLKGIKKIYKNDVTRVSLMELLILLSKTFGYSGKLLLT